jgi:GLPGLI family protein
MKNPFVVFLISFCFTTSFAQNDKSVAISYDVTCTYELSYQPDSTNPNKKSEQFLLFFNPERSFFQSKNQYLRDSVAPMENGTAEDRQRLMSFLRQNPTEFNFNITKQNGTNVTAVDRIYRDFFSYQEPSGHLKWSLLSDTATVSGYPCQKAVTDFGGRRWIAWFTGTIPVSDGPYKFCGLPGLIVKITDVQHYYDFSLIGLKEQTRSIPPAATGNVIAIDKKTFFKKQKQYNENPVAVAEQAGVVFTSGRSEIIQRRKQKLKENNNPIELVKD